MDAKTPPSPPLRRPLTIWITRAQPGADETAALLRALGHAPLVAPVLRVQPLDDVALDLEGVGALAFTSANAVRAFCGRLGVDGLLHARDLPVFAVGEATAKIAGACGFAEVRSAAGDVAALAELIAARHAGSRGLVVHPCAREPAGDLGGVLAAKGVACRTLPLYATLECDALSPHVTQALDRAALDVVLIHSPKAARLVARLVEPWRPAANRDGALAHVQALCLSCACAAPLDGLGLASIRIAPAPSENALLKELAGP